MTTQKTKERKRLRAKVNPVTASYRVSDVLWAVLQPVIPVHENTHRFGGGRPRVPDRQCAEAIVSVLRTGCQGGRSMPQTCVLIPPPMTGFKNGWRRGSS